MIIILVILIVCVIIFGSIEHIIIPQLVTYFKSPYFVLLYSSLRGTINFGAISLVVNGFTLPKKPLLLIATGFINAIMSMCFIYASNPSRTPVVIQSVFIGLAIIPNLFVRNYLIANVKYNYKLVVTSIIILLLSILFAIIPIIEKINFKSVQWMMLYAVAVLLYSIDGVVQEKYICDTQDNSFSNKFSLAFYSSLVQLISVICLYWIDNILGNGSNDFIDSLKSFDVISLVYLEIFVVVCLLLYFALISLNSMSSNYNVILTNITNQSIGIYYSIFHQYNTGIVVPLQYTISSLILNIVSVVLWTFGEHNIEDVQTESV